MKKSISGEQQSDSSLHRLFDFDLLPRRIAIASFVLTLAGWILLPRLSESKVLLRQFLLYSWLAATLIGLASLGRQIKKKSFTYSIGLKIAGAISFAYMALLFIPPGVGLQMKGLASIGYISGHGFNRGDVVWLDNSRQKYAPVDIVLLDWMGVMGGGWGPRYGIREIIAGPNETIRIDRNLGTISVRGKSTRGSIDTYVFKKLGIPFEGYVALDGQTYLVHRGDSVPTYIPARRENLPAQIRVRIPNIFHRLYPDVVY